MIMNDLFDMKVDKINNPKRPLITGQVTVREAHVTNIAFLVTIYGFTYTYLSPELRTMIHLAILNIILYTPILKKALFIKNLSCASLVGFSIYFAGLTTRTLNTPTYLQNQLLTIATRTIFFGSLFNEILLDVRDSQGDLQNGIRTIPNVFGIKKAITFAKLILHINVFWNLFHLIQLFHWRTGIMYILCFTPIFKNLYKTRTEEMTTEMIQKTVNETNMPLFGLLLYLCFLARA
jgi:geranylgeranylglycerol-phosphate geranylgeranyltransferase